MRKPSKPREDAAETLNLFDWADQQAADRVVDFRAWRETSARYVSVIRPHNESIAVVELRFHRRLGIKPPAPIIEMRPRRRA